VPGPENATRSVNPKVRVRVLFGSQIPSWRPDPAFSFSFLELSWFEWRKISNGSNRAVCKAPSRLQAIGEARIILENPVEQASSLQPDFSSPRSTVAS